MKIDNIAVEKKRGLAPRISASGIPLTALLTATFYLQGRAYLFGFLQYFQIDSTQMAISTPDAMWYAYHAWGNGAASVLLKSSQVFFDLVNHFAPPATSFGLISAGAILLVSYARRYPRPTSENGIRIIKPHRRNKFILFCAFIAGYIVSIPTVIILLSFFVVIIVSITVEPFTILGARSAAKYCDKPAASIPTIPALPGFDPGKGTIYQLLCATDTCAVLQANIPSVVPKESIKITISPPLFAVPLQDSAIDVEQLCTKSGLT
ncbi:hypothetical protein [Achromobacter marplatensis]